MNSVVKYSQVNLKDMNYLKPEKVGGSYFGSISYGKQSSPLYIQIPKVTCLTDLQSIQGKKNPMIEIEIPSGKYDMYDFFLSLDDENIKTTVKHTQDWFGKEIPLDIIDEMYKRISQPFRKDTNPKMKFRLPIMKQKFQCGIYNQNRVFQDCSEIKPGSEVILILHIRGLKILKQSFYCDCYVSQIKVFQTKEESFQVMKNYSILDDEEDNEYGEIFSEEIKQSNEEYINEKNKEQEQKRKQIEEEIKQKEEELQNLIDQKQEELQKLMEMLGK